MDESPRDPAADAAPGTPRWVKAFAIGAVGLVLLVVVVMLLAGGEHGPGRHIGSGGGPADAAEATRTVEVTTLDAMRFEPASIEVSAGDTVTFRVTNAGQAVHEFTIGDAAMQHEHAEAMAHMPDGMPHDLPNSITLQPGETRQLTWRFGHGGTLEYACHEPGHYDAGMRGHFTVG